MQCRLSSSDSRTRLTNRAIECNGYERADGLFDVEGSLRDVNEYEIENPWRGKMAPGQAVHEMSVRLRIGADLVIHAVEISIDSAPYPFCQGVKPNLERLVSLKITGGFKQQARKLVGHTQGCTHVLTLVETLATVAIRTLAGKARHDDSARLSIFGAPIRSVRR